MESGCDVVLLILYILVSLPKTTPLQDIDHSDLALEKSVNNQGLIKQDHQDLNGRILRCAHMNVVDYITDNDGTVEGFQVDLVNILAERLNFTVEYVLTPDGSIGVRNSNGSWNGMIGMIQRGEADFALPLLTRTLAREEVVDFSIPLAADT